MHGNSIVSSKTIHMVCSPIKMMLCLAITLEKYLEPFMKWLLNRELYTPSNSYVFIIRNRT